MGQIDEKSRRSQGSSPEVHRVCRREATRLLVRVWIVRRLQSLAAPDNVSMAAVAIAISGGSALSKIETIPLLTVEETLDALRRAQKVSYKAPGT
jgi:hypothetical protein